MFISANFLATNYGVDDRIATFFADREPPANNLYWHKKLLYLGPTPGYLFIPVMVDMFQRLGIKRQLLLADTYIHTMESIGHIAAKQEANIITQAQAVEEAIALVQEQPSNAFYFDAVCNYLRGNGKSFITELVSPFKALHRGDLFLLSACVLPFQDEQAIVIVQYWFAIITLFLLMDDAEDIDIDAEHNEENAFLENGFDKATMDTIQLWATHCLSLLKQKNLLLYKTMDNKLIQLANMPKFKPFINQ
jgi:hypothetical protein